MISSSGSRFRFTDMRFDAASLQAELADAECGGYAAFEGWVRNHNEGRSVGRLEYEAFAPLAVKEGERIVAEACEKFGVEKALCVHRIGSLGVGELAVWVGVSARHRDEAFRACRYIIDEVKHRVPIWKKEHYDNGDSGWVNCERCATAATAAQSSDAGRDPAQHDHGDHDHSHHDRAARTQTAALISPDYSRQMSLPEVGVRGQARLRASHVAVVGAGGLGVPVLQYLAGAGVGRLTVIDGDRLEPSNLHRQTLYALADCGQPKAQLAAARLRALNPDVRVTAQVHRLDATSGQALLGDADLIVDCTDNFATKFLLNDLAMANGYPVLFASVYQYEGQLQMVRPDRGSACLRCIWPEASRDGVVGNCAEAGVLGPVPGVFGSLQALEALKFLLNLPGQLRDELLTFDLTNFRLTRLRARRHSECAGGPCPRSSQALTRASAEGAIELEFESLDAAAAAGYTLIDIREPSEVAAQPTVLRGGSLRQVPLSVLGSNALLSESGPFLMLCARGQRSLGAATALRAQGLTRVYSLRGGLLACPASAVADSSH